MGTVELRVTMSGEMKVLVVLLSLLSFSRSQVIEGLLALDKLSFDKIVERFEYSLIKFDVGFPTGEKHNNFGQLAKEIARYDNLFMGEVRIKDYGDKANQELAERFNVNQEKHNLPDKILFAAESWAGEKGDGAEVYVKIMKGALDTGKQGLIKEKERLAKMLGEKSSDKVKEKLKRKQNVLGSFRYRRDEL